MCNDTYYISVVHMHDLITKIYVASQKVKKGEKKIIVCVKELRKLSPQCSQTCRNVLVLRCRQIDEYQVLKMEGDIKKKFMIVEGSVGHVNVIPHWKYVLQLCNFPINVNKTVGLVQFQSVRACFYFFVLWSSMRHSGRGPAVCCFSEQWWVVFLLFLLLLCISENLLTIWLSGHVGFLQESLQLVMVILVLESTEVVEDTVVFCIFYKMYKTVDIVGQEFGAI